MEADRRLIAAESLKGNFEISNIPNHFQHIFISKYVFTNEIVQM